MEVIRRAASMADESSAIEAAIFVAMVIKR